MKLNENLSRSDYEHLIDEWIFDERDRKILKRRILDGILFEDLAEEFDLSVQWAKKRVYRCMDKLSKHMQN